MLNFLHVIFRRIEIDDLQRDCLARCDVYTSIDCSVRPSSDELQASKDGLNRRRVAAVCRSDDV